MKSLIQKHNIKSDGKFILLIIILAIILLICFFASFMIGRYSGVDVLTVIKILWNSIFGNLTVTWTKTQEVVVLSMRLPRIFATILVGAALPISGAAYQALFANPMASSDTLGVSSGASVGAVIAILTGMSYFVTEVMAFAVGCVAVVFVFFVSLSISKGRNLTVYLILVGMVVSALLSSVLSILKYLATEQQLPEITFWLLGSFQSVTVKEVRIYSIFFVVGAIPLFLLRWRMNLLSLSDHETKSMGENTNVLRAITILCATLLTAASTAMTGGIGWVGLVIPHISRIMVGHDFRKVMPVSALMGSIFLLMTDNMARSISINEIPIGILTALIGAPIFFVMLVKNRRNLLVD